MAFGVTTRMVVKSQHPPPPLDIIQVKMYNGSVQQQELFDGMMEESAID